MSEALFSLTTVGGLLVLSQLSPGPDIYFVVHTALSRGFLAAMAVAAGICTGFCIQAVLVCTLGAQVMQQPWSKYVLYAAAVWLLYLAWRIFPRSFRGSSICSALRPAVSQLRLFWQGFLCNILNVKCMLFIAALCLGPLAVHASHPWFPAALVAVTTLSGMAGWALWSSLLQLAPVRRFYETRSRGIDALFAVALAVFAALLLFD